MRQFVLHSGIASIGAAFVRLVLMFVIKFTSCLSIGIVLMRIKIFETFWRYIFDVDLFWYYLPCNAPNYSLLKLIFFSLNWYMCKCIRIVPCASVSHNVFQRTVPYGYPDNKLFWTLHKYTCIHHAFVNWSVCINNIYRCVWSYVIYYGKWFPFCIRYFKK